MLPKESLAPYQGKNILVTGGAGFVGSNLVKNLLDAAPRKITIVDNLMSAEKANVPAHQAVRFVEASITDDAVLKGLDADLDYVFHLATYHGNQSSIADPIADHDNNTLTTLKLYDTLKTRKNLTRVVYSSAGCTVAEKTFGDAVATTEEAPVSLWHDSPYQISKLIGELYSNFYFLQHQLPVVKARFQNVYGPGEILGAGRWRGTPATVWRNVTPTFVYRALKRLPLKVESKEATRDFIFVEDIVHGLILCGGRGKPGEVYNLASGAETSIYELAEMINRMTESPVPIELAPPRPWDRSGKRYGSPEKARAALGFECKTSIRPGLERTIEWTRANLALIDACIAKHKQHMPALS